jgi:zinc protease
MQTTIFVGSFAVAPAWGLEMPPVERTVLDNGLRLLVIRQPHLPMVVLSALVDAGSRFDARGQEGLSGMTAGLLTEGTAKRKAAEIHDETDFLGAKLGAGAGDDYVTVSLTVLKKDLEHGIDLFSDVLLHPSFPKNEFARKREEALAELEAEEQNPGAVADRTFRRALYGEGPYRAAPGGWKESVAKLTVADVRRFYQAGYRPERTILVVSGDVTLDEMKALCAKELTPWKGKGKAVEALPPVDNSRADVVRVDRELTQANLVFGHSGTTRDDPNWYAIQVMNYILGGGGFSSRLMQSIRVEGGLAYSVYSFFSPGKPGAFEVVLQTKSASTGEAMKRLRSEIDRIRSEEVSDEELRDAKKYLTGSFPLRFDSNAEMVSFYAQVEYYNLGLDYPSRYESIINEISKEDLQRVAQQYLHPEKALLVIVGKQGDIAL